MQYVSTLVTSFRNSDARACMFAGYMHYSPELFACLVFFNDVINGPWTPMLMLGPKHFRPGAACLVLKAISNA